jgi:hypothetical protein
MNEHKPVKVVEEEEEEDEETSSVTSSAPIQLESSEFYAESNSIWKRIVILSEFLW